MQKFYSLKNILSKNAVYNLIIGERSNGKSYAVKEYCIKEYFANGSQTAMLRRWADDIKVNKCETMFDDLIANGVIEKYSKGKYNTVKFKRGKWFFAFQKDDEIQISEEPFAYAFSLSGFEHYKSNSYPFIKIVFFDEFLTRGYYLNDEFMSLMNALSTIIRLKNDVKIFMCGNTVNQYAPYFDEMGLTNITKMNKGDIDVYTYGNSSLTVAVEFSDFPAKSKPSDFYFAFDNPKLQMITGSGDVWEMGLYPHCPVKYYPTDIIFTYFIKFGTDVLQCEIVEKENNLFTFIHTKTSEIKNTDTDLIFSLESNSQYNFVKKINSGTNTTIKKIYSFFLNDKVFYQNNKIGEIVRNYLTCCK